MRVHHIAMRTRDVARLLDFYRDMLGLRPWAAAPQGRVWLDAGGTILMLENAGDAEPDVSPGTNELVAFAIEPSERPGLEARLRSAGVSIEAWTDFTIYLRDPDGRRLGLSHFPDR
jgi:catechol 2,3-dioxygenase-like lactoylglutathione lyase family enzyme